MAKFCTNCGRPLIDGQPCSCMQSDNSFVQDASQTTYDSEISNFTMGFFKSLYEFIIRFFKFPVSILSQVIAKEDYKTGILFLILQIITSSLLNIIMLNRIIKIGSDVIWRFAGLFISQATDFDSVFTIPYFSYFMKFMTFFVLQFFVLAIVIFVVSKFIFNGKGTFKVLIAVLGTTLIPIFAASLASLLFVFVSLKFTMYLMILSFLVTIFLNAFGIKRVFGFTEDKAVYAIALSYLVDGLLIIEIISQNIRF